MSKSKVKPLLILLLNTAIFAIAAFALPVLFEDNDDTTMAWIANGVYSGTPDCHLVFINAIWGSLLSFLYTIIPSIEWYSLLFAVLQIVSMTIILLFINNMFGRSWSKYLFFLVYYVLWFLIIIRFQFTTTSAITAFAACLLLYKKQYIAGGILLVIASMVRFSAAGLVGLLMAPALVYAYRKDLIRGLVPLALVLVCVAGVYKADSLFYQTPEWSYFREFNSLRGKINDNPNLWRVIGHYPDGITQGEFNTVAAFAIDPNMTTADELRDILNVIDSTPSYKKAKNIYPCLILRYWKWIITMLLFFFVPIILYPNKRLAFFTLLIIGYWLTILAFITLNGSLKFRVFLSAIIPMFFYSGLMFPSRSSRIIVNCFSIIPFMLVMLLFVQCIIEQRKRIESKEELFEEQISLVATVRNYSIISAGADFYVEMYPPFMLSKVIPPQVFINPYCMMASPLNNAYDSYDDLVDSKLCFMSSVDRGFDLYIEELSNNYGIQADTTRISKSEHFCLVGLTEKEQ